MGYARKIHKSGNHAGDELNLPLISSRFPPSGFTNYRIYLFTLYRHLKTAKRKYKYSTFSEQLGFDSNKVNLKSVIHQGKKLDHLDGRVISNTLCLNRNEARYLERLIDYTNCKDRPDGAKYLLDLAKAKKCVVPGGLSPDQKSYLSRYYIPIVGELASLPQFDGTAECVVKELVPVISVGEAEHALEVLVEVGILTFDSESRRYFRTENDLSTSDEVTDAMVNNYHREMIELARQSINTIDQDKREISTLTVTVNEALAEKIKAMVHEFENQVLTEENSVNAKEKNQIYQMNIQFFPVTSSSQAENSDTCSSGTCGSDTCSSDTGTPRDRLNAKRKVKPVKNGGES